MNTVEEKKAYEVVRLRDERDAFVLRAREVRLAKGATSPEFASAWFDVERATRYLEEARAELAKEAANG